MCCKPIRLQDVRNLKEMFSVPFVAISNLSKEFFMIFFRMNFPVSARLAFSKYGSYGIQSTVSSQNSDKAQCFDRLGKSVLYMVRAALFQGFIDQDNWPPGICHEIFFSCTTLSTQAILILVFT